LKSSIGMMDGIITHFSAVTIVNREFREEILFLPHGYFKCCKCKEFPDREECEYRIIEYSRCDSVRKAWSTIRKKANIEYLKLHDIRRFFNRCILQEKLGFSPLEAGCYIGNSEEVNLKHYSPISPETLDRKINNRSFEELVYEN
jgi:hypothetical protein